MRTTFLERLYKVSAWMAAHITLLVVGVAALVDIPDFGRTLRNRAAYEQSQAATQNQIYARQTWTYRRR